MKPSEQISEYVRLSLSNGDEPEAIRGALAGAGWSPPEIDDAIAGWMPGRPPVPRPRPYASAQEALVYGLLFISLGAISWHLCQLGMALIDYLIPDPGDYPVSPGSSARWSIAALIAFTPVFLLLSRRIARLGGEDSGRSRSLVRKWFASLTLLVASLVFLGDAVYVIYALLNGDLTLRFICRAALVASIATLVLAYYRDELHG